MKPLKLTLAGAAALLTAGAAHAQELNLICSADVVICELLVEQFEAGHDIDVNMVRLSSGEAYAKIRAEGRNPQTGEKIKIPAANVPRFKASKALKDAIN